MPSPYTLQRSKRRQEWAIAARYSVSVLLTTAVALALPLPGSLWRKAWQLAATVSVVAAFPLVGQVPRKALERVGGTASGGLLGLLAARASQQAVGLWPLAPSLVLSLAAALMALGTARLCLAEGLTASLRLSIISFLSTAFSAQAMAGSETLHALVQTAGVAIAVLLNVSAAILILPQTGTMHGARSVGDAWQALLKLNKAVWAVPTGTGPADPQGCSGSATGRRPLGYAPLPSESDVEACLVRATVDGVENLLTDINAALLSVKSMEPIAKQELHVGRTIGGRHLFLPRLRLLLGSQPPQACLPWTAMTEFVLSIRRTARRLAAISELLAHDGHSTFASQAHLTALLEEHASGILAGLTVALNALDDPASLHAASTDVDQLGAALEDAKAEDGHPLLLYLAQRVAQDLGALTSATSALVKCTPHW